MDLIKMEKEPLVVRHCKINKVVTNDPCLMQLVTQEGSRKVSYDTLFDVFFALFDECGKDSFRKDVNVSYFFNKYKGLVTELRSLRVKFSDFELKNVIGRGQFGEVRLVREKCTGDYYAMKILSKAQTLNNPSAALFEEERDILSCNSSEWLTKLNYAFYDRKCLYFVMEFHAGGDLRSLLDRSEGQRFSVDSARFYIAETLMSIRALHQLGYVHRDIKPANILLDQYGHVKLADFGSAARMRPDKGVVTAMPVGTPDYVAPEVLRSAENPSDPYGLECDFWSLGVLAYTMVVGSGPFASSRTAITYSRILNHVDTFKSTESAKSFITYPDSVSVTDSLKDLINKLLTPASVRPDFNSTRSHIFFLELDFDNLRQSMPPFVPILTSNDDISNFTKLKTKSIKSSDSPLTPRDEKREPFGKQLPFVGFTFTRGCLDSEATKDRGLFKVAQLEQFRKENRELLSKMFSARNSDNERELHLQRLLEKNEQDIMLLRQDLVKERSQSSALRKALEDDRSNRRQVEEAALEIARKSKLAYEREAKTTIAQLHVQLEQLTDELTEAHTVSNELASRADRADADVVELRKEVARLRAAEQDAQATINKARELKRRSVAGLESCLDEMAAKSVAHMEKLQKRLANEQAARMSAENAYHQSEREFTLKEEAWMREESKLRRIITELESKIANCDVKRTEELQVANCKLEDEQREVQKLRMKLVTMETDLSNSINSFVKNESAISLQVNELQQLENDLRKVTQEKITLETTLESSKIRDKENRSKLADLEKMLEKLAEEVVKLEKENNQLKLNSAKSDEEIPVKQLVEFEQKLILSEQQIKKLEEQNDKLREQIAEEKLQLRNTQANLWKTEKELSNAKIDIRILQREAKSMEVTLGRTKEELSAQNERLKSAQNDVNDLNLQLTEKEILTKELELLRKSLDDALNREKNLQQQYNDLRSDLSELEGKYKNECTNNMQSNRTNNELQRENNNLCNELDQVREKLDFTERNNVKLRETVTSFDSQLEEYEHLVNERNKTINSLQNENEKLLSNVCKLKDELSNAHVLNEVEREKRVLLETEVSTFRTLLADRDDVICEIRAQENAARSNLREHINKLLEADKIIAELRNELSEHEREKKVLNDDLAWLKKECSELRTALYACKEKTYRLEHELANEVHYGDALQDRIEKLEGVITDLEAFHRMREVKDEATKHQQNKLISFLQAKLEEDRKKKSLTDILFGQRRKEATNPPSSSSSNCPSSLLKESPIKSPKALTDSTAPLQRKLSLPGLKHNIPHHFELQQRNNRADSDKCAGCYTLISRGSRQQVMVCRHCRAISHPKCAPSAPKTCGLSPALVKHIVSDITPDIEKPSAENTFSDGKGWADFMGQGDTSWSRKFLSIQSDLLEVHQNDESTGQPQKVINLHPASSQILVGDVVEQKELPFVAARDLPFIIKIAVIPKTTCWPLEIHYIRTSNTSEKIQWVTALQAAINANHFEDHSAVPNLNSSVNHEEVILKNVQNSCYCIHELNNGILLLGTDDGLYSLRDRDKPPVKIRGVNSVQSIYAAPDIGVTLLLLNEPNYRNRMVITDYRIVQSNAEAAACSDPHIVVHPFSSDIPMNQTVLHFAVSKEKDRQSEGVRYVAVATDKQIILYIWCSMSSRFVRQRALDIEHAATCFVFTETSLIVGADYFTRINLSNFEIHQVISRSDLVMSLRETASCPMKTFVVTSDELLLCYHAMGIFVDKHGNKTRNDLKWTRVPRDFELVNQYLYMVTFEGVEIIQLPSIINSDLVTDMGSVASLATTAVDLDTTFISLKTPMLLGPGKRGVYIFSENNILLVEGGSSSKIGNDDFGSVASLVSKMSVNTLKRNPSNGEFSFTSSIIDSLDNQEET